MATFKKKKARSERLIGKRVVEFKKYTNHNKLIAVGFILLKGNKNLEQQIAKAKMEYKLQEMKRNPQGYLKYKYRFENVKYY